MLGLVLVLFLFHFGGCRRLCIHFHASSILGCRFITVLLGYFDTLVYEEMRDQFGMSMTETSKKINDEMCI